MSNSQKSNRPKVIIVIGPPGSGKGTQAELLGEKLNLYYLETSKILEANIMKAKKGEYVMVKGKKYFLEKEKKNWETGKLVSPPLTAFWMKNKIRTLFKEGKDLIMAGSPRSLAESKEIIPLLKKLYGVKNLEVIFLKITAKESIWRNSHRKICQLMRHPILYTKETAKLTQCPLDGSKLLKRKGLDTPETIKVRLKEYKERTLPMVDYFKKEKLRVKKVNGSPPPAVVFENILESLK